MKILLVHNHYGSEAPSGEERMFYEEFLLLKQMGHDVYTFETYSDWVIKLGILGKFLAAIVVPWNPITKYFLQKKVKKIKPDVIHVHNTFPLLSPSIFYIKKGKAVFVKTLHNYRLQCPGGIPMREEAICTNCITKKSVVDSLIYGCYKKSRVLTLPIAVNVWLHRKLKTWHKRVDAFVVMTKFQKNLICNGDFPASKVFVKPNFLLPSFDKLKPYHERNGSCVYIGRLSPEKGVRNLIETWRLWGQGAPLLKIVGDGEERFSLESEAKGLPIEFVGQVDKEQVNSIISDAALLILPSKCLETFGLVVIEALSRGTPVAVSNTGGLPSLITHGVNGFVFDSCSPVSMLRTLTEAFSNYELLNEMSFQSTAIFDSKYLPDGNYSILHNIYQKVINNEKSI